MIVTLNQIAYFKPQTTARRLKNYYLSADFRPEVFLSYLRLINITATLCQNVAKLSLTLYRKEVRELFFSQRHNPTVLKQLWRFRRFFTSEECCRLLQGAVLTPQEKIEEIQEKVVQPAQKEETGRLLFSRVFKTGRNTKTKSVFWGQFLSGFSVGVPKIIRKL